MIMSQTCVEGSYGTRVGGERRHKRDSKVARRNPAETYQVPGVVIQSFLKASEEKELYGRLTGRGRYYDRDLSCFTGTETKPTGLLLAHKKPSGEIEIEYIGYTAEVGEDVMALVGSCISAAKSKFGAATDMILYPDSEEFESFLDKFLPSPKVVPMIIGSLSNPEEIQASADVITEVLDSLKLEEEASEE